MQKVTFIGGTGRSGTNLIKSILGQHSTVHTLPFEHRFTIDPGGLVDFYNSYSSTWSPFFSDKRIKDLERYLLSLANLDKEKDKKSQIIKALDNSGKKLTTYPYSGWELNNWFPNYETYVHELINELTTVEYNGCWPGSDGFVIENTVKFGDFLPRVKIAEILGRFYLKCVNALLDKEKKTLFVEDNTWNILYASELLELIPESKLVHVIRDPRDVIASFLQQRWAPNNLRDVIHWYKNIILKWFEVKNKINDENLYILKLEDLVLHPDSEIQKLCGNINIQFESKMSEINISQTSQGRWIEEFNREEKQLLGKELAEVLKLLNYKE